MNFSEASLAIVLRTLQPVIDMFTNGAASNLVDALGDRGAAIRILGEQLFQLGEAIENAARGGLSEDLIHAIVLEAADVPAALKLLQHPENVQMIDGKLVVADDDVDPTASASGSDASTPDLGSNSD